MLFDQIDAVAQTEIAHSSEEARWFEDVRQRKHEHAVRDEFDDNNSISHEKCVHLLYQIRSALVDLWKNEREKTEWWMNSGEKPWLWFLFSFEANFSQILSIWSPISKFHVLRKIRIIDSDCDLAHILIHLISSRRNVKMTHNSDITLCWALCAVVTTKNQR